MTTIQRCVAPCRAVLFSASVTIVYFFIYRLGSQWLVREEHWVADTVYIKLGLALLFVFAFERNFEKLGLQLPRRDAILGGVVVPAATFFAAYLATGYYLGWNARSALHYLCTASAEELFLTGFIFAQLRPLGVIGSACFMSFLFAALHLPTQFPGVLRGEFSYGDALGLGSLFARSIFSAGVRIYSGSLLPCVALHFLMDYMPDFYSSRGSILLGTNPTLAAVLGLAVEQALIFAGEGFVLLVLARRRAGFEAATADRNLK
jgi:hypothetical protein